EWQIAIALHPLREHVVDDRLRRRPKDQGLIELLAAPVRDNGELWREAFHVLGLLLHEALGNEKREVGVSMPGFLEHVIESALHPLPDAVAIRANDHAAA